MTVRSLKKWLVPLALGTVSIGSIATETVAATIYSFSGELSHSSKHYTDSRQYFTGF